MDSGSRCSPDHLIAVFIGSFSFILLHLSGECSVAFIPAHEPGRITVFAAVASPCTCTCYQPSPWLVLVSRLVFHQANRHLCAYIRVHTCMYMYNIYMYVYTRKYIRRGGRGNGEMCFRKTRGSLLPPGSRLPFTASGTKLSKALQLDHLRLRRFHFLEKLATTLAEILALCLIESSSLVVAVFDSVC